LISSAGLFHLKQMNDRVSVTLTSLTASYLIMATAASIMIGWIERDWTLFIPSMMLLGGMFALYIGFKQRSDVLLRREMNDSNFLMFWGTMLMVFGIIWVMNYAYPGNELLMLIAFLVWMALAVLVFTIRKR